MKHAATAPRATFVIFGVLDDITRRLLVPALVNLSELGLLAPETETHGVSHHECDDEGLRPVLYDFLKKVSGWGRLSDHVHYMKDDFTDAKTFKALAGKLCGNVVFYLRPNAARLLWPDRRRSRDYEAGSAGPKSADALMHRAHRRWHKLG